LRAISFLIKLKPYAHLTQKRLEFFVQRPISVYASKSEQKTEVDLVVIWIKPILEKNSIIGLKQCAVWEALCLRKGLRSCNNEVEDFDICATSSTKRRDTMKCDTHFHL
jgi:hypothetical protein